MKKFVVILFLLSAILSWPVFYCSADNSLEIDKLNQAIAEKKEKTKQLEASIAEYKEKIAKKQLEAVSLNNQMSILDNRMSAIELDIQATTEKLNSIMLEIEALNLSIQDKEEIINKQKDLVAELLRTLHYKNGKSYIKIAATYENFSDFYNQVQYLKTVETDLTKNVKNLKLAKTELENKKDQTEERKIAYEDVKQDLQAKKEELQAQVNVKQNLLIKTRSSEAAFKTVLSNLKTQYQQIEGEITGIEQEVRKKLAEQNKLESLSTDDDAFGWPVPSHYITSGFRDPDYPYRNVFEHTGIDIRASQGTAVRAVASGYVGIAKRCSLASCYSYVMLIHSSGLATVYGHLNKITVNDDQFVTRGDVIGYSGGTPGTAGAGPFVTGPHLHLEVRKNGIPVNPLNYLAQ